MPEGTNYGPSLRPVLGILPGVDGGVPGGQKFLFLVDAKPEMAEGICRDLLARNPTHTQAMHLLGLIAFNGGRIALAIEQIRMAIEASETPSSLYLVNLGLVLNAAGRQQQAIELLRRACAMEPDHLDFNTKLAAVLLNAGRLEEAMSVIRRSLQIQPTDMQALETLRMIEMRQQGGDPPDQPVVVRPAAAEQGNGLGTNDYSVTISARTKQGHVSQMLHDYFAAIPLGNIDSLFGFHRRCRLYGGREFATPEINDDDLNWMYSNSIGYRIPLTNTLVTEEDYAMEQPFLQLHHRRANSVIVVNSALAKWIRRDFPLYKIEASVIRGTDTADKLLKTLETFDTVVPLPEAFNTNYDLLKSFTQDVKDRIRLFLNVGCMYHCPHRICYTSFSRLNRQEPGAQFECSQRRFSYHFTQGMTDFPMQRFLDIGYRKFKLLRTKLSSGGAAW